MEGLGIDIKLLIAQIFNFLLLFLIFKKTVYRSFLEFLSRQEEQEKERERILKNLEEQEKRIKEKENLILNEARKENLRILAEAKKAAAKLKEEIIQQTKAEVEEMKEKAKRQLEEERTLMLKEVKRKAVETASTIARTVLKEFVDERVQGQLLKNLFNKFEKSKSYEN